MEIIADITERRLIAQDLAERQSKLSAIVANLPRVVYRCDFQPTKTISFVSEGVERLTGYSVETVISGKDGWQKFGHPDDRDRAVAKIAAAVANVPGVDGSPSREPKSR